MEITLNHFDFLKPNDIIDIVAPASKPATLIDVENFLETWQLRSHVPEDLFGEDLFSANSVSKRVQHLQAALTNPNSKAIWCVRGGYGSMKLIPELSKMTPPSKPKFFIGSSDITALHIFLQDKWGWPTLHAPTLFSAVTTKVSDASLTILKKIIFREVESLVFTKIKPLNSFAKNIISIVAPITGGNLSLIVASLGTPWQIDARDKILLIEEVNERGYRIDRMLEQLQQAGVIQATKAILFGDMLGGAEADGACYANDAVKLFADACQKPVLQISGVGHGKENDALILGVPAEIKLGNTPSLEIKL